MRNRAQGFSMIELTMVVLISLTLAGLSLVGFQQARAMFSGNSAEQMVSSKLRQAREMAMAQRKNITVSFIEPNRLQILVQTSATTSSLLEDLYLPVGVSYSNGVGSGNPENMSSLLNLRASSFAYFGDGSARDINTGDPINGVIYLGSSTTSNLSALSAITVLASTGRVRTYHYNVSNGGWF